MCRPCPVKKRPSLFTENDPRWDGYDGISTTFKVTHSIFILKPEKKSEWVKSHQSYLFEGDGGDDKHQEEAFQDREAEKR